MRLGAVPYLNALPLRAAILGSLELEVPSRLVRRYESGLFDAALLPTYKILQQPRPLIVDGVCISSYGEVFSVFLAHRKPLEEIRYVSLDPSSCTSNALFRCLCAEFLGLSPEFSVRPLNHKDESHILIGDPAIDFRLSAPAGWRFLDLGAIWTSYTGLPFVYAAWSIREKSALQIAEFLRSAKRAGIQALAELIARRSNPIFTSTYLNTYIRYDLGELEKRSLVRFAELLYKHGLSSAGSCNPSFV
ncbi:MAG: menaquinone biosynthesis protein [Candidatus Xiphinematobacter sp.]|nr:MAG: menaquinone biosynthesis protein [Candidatus Xiphinematobacter sp.]QQY08699.1 MAG: menaquinone biosynthesis protein [Candidatus Xiphinematobacter sp.]QQY09433.1 MAG: menaquinone biosynthesis protein [Candidatus Xiphinematobacter sp.]QQY10184.1 MAG: menaquinone biosynthesis protein [Candidatus Xiphinematobacter sp.]QQY10920.1 MAG: menaquinone biosynthesis protein [Candidatus Xiphinematobacter sp.]